jgi:hypothetical protein
VIGGLAVLVSSLGIPLLGETLLFVEFFVSNIQHSHRQPIATDGCKTLDDCHIDDMVQRVAIRKKVSQDKRKVGYIQGELRFYFVLSSQTFPFNVRTGNDSRTRRV